MLEYVLMMELAVVQKSSQKTDGMWKVTVIKGGRKEPVMMAAGGFISLQDFSQ